MPVRKRKDRKYKPNPSPRSPKGILKTLWKTPEKVSIVLPPFSGKTEARRMLNKTFGAIYGFKKDGTPDFPPSFWDALRSWPGPEG